MQVNVRMMGVLRGTSGIKEVPLDIPESCTVGALIKQLIEDGGGLSREFWDDSVDSPSPNASILVNGVEIKNLEGIDTVLEPAQEIVLLSVVHGG